MPTTKPYPICVMTGVKDQEYILMNDFVLTFSLAKHEGVYKLTIKKGFIWDGGTIPRVCWSAMGITPHGTIECEVAFLVHDVLYATQLLPQYVCDEILCDLILAYGGTDIMVQPIFGAVQAFGKPIYDDCPDKETMLDYVILEHIEK